MKDKTFFFLSVTVLAHSGICGVTSQFAVVRWFVLRGFSFPHPEQLMSVGLIDPQASAQNNNFGNGVVSFLAGLRGSSRRANIVRTRERVLNGSTINVSYRRTPQRYTGGYVTGGFLQNHRGRAGAGARTSRLRTTSRARKRSRFSGTSFGSGISNGDPHIVGEPIRINGQAATIIGVMPPNFKFPISEELWVPLYNEFPAQAARAIPRLSVPQIMGRLKPGVTLDQVNAGIYRAGKAPRERQSKNERPTRFREPCSRCINSFTGPQLRQTGLRNAQGR